MRRMIQIGKHTLHCGDCLDVLRTLEAESIDTIITDSPYGIRFMGAAWDGKDIENGIKREVPRGSRRTDGRTVARDQGAHMAGSYDLSLKGNRAFQAWCTSWAEAVLRVAKPGAMLLAFGGTRTWHRLVCALEDAGWEIRDTLMYMYGAGFPKSLDVGKAIDKAAGAERERVGRKIAADGTPIGRMDGNTKQHEGYQRPWRDKSIEDQPTAWCTMPATDAAKLWDGWGTALKPAWEPIVVAMKPLDGSFAQNAIKHGVAGLSVDACRIGTQGESFSVPQSDPSKRAGEVGTDLGITRANKEKFQAAQRASIDRTATLGRWPANAILDEDAAAMLDEQSGERCGANGAKHDTGRQHGFKGNRISTRTDDWGEPRDALGGASRFFYTAKASRSDRGRDNKHPTVKPLALMEYLCKLTATPTGGIVLDPFMGSGSTGVACERQGRTFIGIEKERRSFGTACRRMRRAAAQQKFDFVESAS